jgi:hypothetical protein
MCSYLPNDNSAREFLWGPFVSAQRNGTVRGAKSKEHGGGAMLFELTAG